MSGPKHGSLLGQRYRLERRLGWGGMASVWEADDRRLARRVAVKVMLGQHLGKSDALSRFERETMAVAKLDSPHIVQVHDYGVDDGRPYMVMELLRGETLAQRLTKVRRLPPRNAASLARDLAKALQTAHEARIVHRDLKPGNVFLVRDHGDEIAKVFDFGISKALSPLRGGTLTHEGTFVGTPHYMSPEQMRGSSKVDPRADLWSLGVILYRVTTGKLPFDGADLRSVISAVLEQPTPSVGSIARARELDAFFARALRKDPSERFASALQLSEAFLEAAAPELAPRRAAIVPPPLPRRRPKPPPLPRARLELSPPPDLPPPAPLGPPPRLAAEEAPTELWERTKPPAREERRESAMPTALSLPPRPAQHGWSLGAAALVLIAGVAALGSMHLESDQGPAQAAAAPEAPAAAREPAPAPLPAPQRSAAPSPSAVAKAKTAPPRRAPRRRPAAPPPAPPEPPPQAPADAAPQPSAPPPPAAPAPAADDRALFEEPW